MSQAPSQQLTREQQIAALEKDWATNPRWKGVKRGYTAADVVRLRGSLPIEHTLARRGAEKLWEKVNGGAKKGYVNAFGAISAGQAMQQAKAGLEAVYLSGWQVAADGNTSETMYPDQSLYAYDSVPTLARQFQSETGMSFRQWRQQARLVEALGHLANGVPVARIAEKLGYRSASAFTAMFKRALGLEPRRYFAVEGVEN